MRLRATIAKPTRSGGLEDDERKRVVITNQRAICRFAVAHFAQHRNRPVLNAARSSRYSR